MMNLCEGIGYKMFLSLLFIITYIGNIYSLIRHRHDIRFKKNRQPNCLNILPYLGYT